MKEIAQSKDNSQSESKAVSGETVLFDSSLCSDDEFLEYDLVMRGIGEILTPSVLTGTLGLWNGRTDAYKYCGSIEELGEICSNRDYDKFTICQDGERLHFTFLHHDGRNSMELRRFTEYGIENWDDIWDAHYCEEALGFIEENTLDFGNVNTSVKQ